MTDFEYQRVQRGSGGLERVGNGGRKGNFP